jgi:hypothetical protein
MTAIKLEDVPNHDQPLVKDLLNKFKNRNEMNIVDVSEVISKLITTLSIDHDSGRPKLYAISQGHLSEILGIGKGVVSQYMSVWNMSNEAKDFLKNHNTSLIDAYTVAKVKGKDATEILRLQKEHILNRTTTIGVSRKRTDILLHTINESQMVLNGIIISYKISATILETIPELESTDKEYLVSKAKIYINNINKCINHLSPKIQRLPYLQKEIEFCTAMNEHGETKFCGKDIDVECLNKQIQIIKDEIALIKAEQKLPHISSLLMMKANLEKNI